MLFCTNVTLTAAATVNKVCAYICSCMTTFIIGFRTVTIYYQWKHGTFIAFNYKNGHVQVKGSSYLTKNHFIKKTKIQPIVFVVFLPIRKIYYTFTCFLDSLTYSATCHFAINGFTVRAMTTWKSSPQVVNRYEKIMHLQVI